MANINSRNISEAEEELRLAYTDLVAFGKLFLPDDFMRSESPFFHYEVCDALNDHSHRQLAVILPRGHGKIIFLVIKKTPAQKIRDYFNTLKWKEVKKANLSGKYKYT